MSTTQNILTMKDEDFLRDFNNLPAETPAVVVSPEATTETTTTETVETPAATTPETTTTTTETVETAESTETTAVAGGEGETATGETVTTTTTETPAATVEDTFDYKAAYEKIVGPTFKANGKDVKVTSVDEAVRLMQMGVGFHGRMAKMAGVQRYIDTLQENGLLTEEKINELVDISKKNPEAIAALVRSAGLEPHQLIAQGDAPTYKPGNHVPDETVAAFRTSVAEIRDESDGVEFLNQVASWDATSRAEIVQDPSALHLLYGHTQSGVFDKISTEIERRKLFDPTVAKLPFIRAYLAVGNELHAKGELAPQSADTTTTTTTTTTPAPPATPPVPVVPVSVKPAVATQPVAPNPAAVKAGSVRATSTPASATPNYLTMSDEEFLKNHAPK